MDDFSKGNARPQSNARATSPTLQQQNHSGSARAAPPPPPLLLQQQQPQPQQQQQQRQSHSSSASGSVQLTTASGRAYHMNLATGKGSWVPPSQNSKSAPSPASSSIPHPSQQRPQGPAPSKAAAASGDHPLLQPLLSAQDSNERITHARTLAAILRDDSVARMSLCNPEALSKLLRMLQFEIPADEAFFLLMCLTNILIEQSAQICCVSIPFCIPMLVQRAAKWSQISNQQHPNICFAALANLCLQDDGCSVCSRSGVFRCLSLSLNAEQDTASLHYCMRLLSSLFGHPHCSASILNHNDILPNFFKSALSNAAQQDAQVAESAAIVLRSIYDACRCSVVPPALQLHTTTRHTTNLTPHAALARISPLQQRKAARSLSSKPLSPTVITATTLHQSSPKASWMPSLPWRVTPICGSRSSLNAECFPFWPPSASTTSGRNSRRPL